MPARLRRRRALADELEVEAGYELALAAALDGRLRAAVVADLAAGASLLDGAGADGGSALVAGAARGQRRRAPSRPRPARSGWSSTSAAPTRRWRWSARCWPTPGWSTRSTRCPRTSPALP